MDSLVVSALQDTGGHVISHQNNLELHLGCHTWWLSYFTLVCPWCRRMVAQSVYGHVITKFSWMGRLLHFLTYGALLAHFVCESSGIKPLFGEKLWLQSSIFHIPKAMDGWEPATHLSRSTWRKTQRRIPVGTNVYMQKRLSEKLLF